MSLKRNRTTFEQQQNINVTSSSSSFVIFGSSLPAPGTSNQDDGSFVPVWKQEVTDERGRKRLHGAFTGGFSAGYFNTVGSKEGWSPTTYKSSRTARSSAPVTRTEDLMDQEDLDAAADALKLETSKGFGGLGSGATTGKDQLEELFLPRPSETYGVRMMQRMGWKHGQGVGPRVRRNPRGMDNDIDSEERQSLLLAPLNRALIATERIKGLHGLGYENCTQSNASVPITVSKARKSKTRSFGISAFTDEEDPYESGTPIIYKRSIDPLARSSGSSVGLPRARQKVARHVFTPKKTGQAQAHLGQHVVCHDGRSPLEGFCKSFESTVDVNFAEFPEVPADWELTTIEQTEDSVPTPGSISVKNLDPRERGTLLGETSLPGKSIFDFISPSARNRIATLSGKGNLPPGLGQKAANAGSSMDDIVPFLDEFSARSALDGFIPYSDDPEKKGRYRVFLEVKAGLRDGPPIRKYGMNTCDWIREMNEFISAARVFRPSTGAIATRFSSASSGNDDWSLNAAYDAASKAADLSMYGPLTRTRSSFTPARLICKRFNIDDAQFHNPIADEDGAVLPPNNTVNMPSAVYMETPIDSELNEALEGERAADDIFSAVFGDLG